MSMDIFCETGTRRGADKRDHPAGRLSKRGFTSGEVVPPPLVPDRQNMSMDIFCDLGGYRGTEVWGDKIFISRTKIVINTERTRYLKYFKLPCFKTIIL